MSYSSSCDPTATSQLVESSSKRKFPPHPLIYDLLNHPELNVMTATTTTTTSNNNNNNSPAFTPSPSISSAYEQFQDLPRLLTPDQFGMMSTWQHIDIRVPPDSILSYSEGEEMDLEDTNQSHVMVFESEEEEEEEDDDEEIDPLQSKVKAEDNDEEENTFIMPRMSVSSQGKNINSSSLTTNNLVQGTNMTRTELIIIVRSPREDDDFGSFNDPLGLLNGWNAIYSFLVGIGLGLGFGIGFFY